MERKEQKQRKEERQISIGKRESSNLKRESGKVKATYKQQKEYEQLTNDIERLTAERAELESLLSSGEVTDHAKITEASERIGQLIGELDEKELRWLELDEIVQH